ncbi:hypothetical protein ACFXG4_08260 [Nocardia sp. NPDC059246]|uniref:hypothetical protein n=1 Tax=unclassified Nocardia TaxID=2637762 RepID=UPI0036C2A79E
MKLRLPTRVPEPALVRTTLMTITAVAAYILGRQIDTQWVETVTTIYSLVVAPLIAAFLTRKVVKPDPVYFADFGGRHRRDDAA